MFKTLIQAPELRALMETGQPLLVMDCSFDLMNPEAGRQQFDTEHLPGAVYVHLDTDLVREPFSWVRGTNAFLRARVTVLDCLSI